MVELIYLCLHANLKFPQRIIVTQDAEKHDDEVSPPVKTLYILLTTDSLTTQLLNFCLVKQIYYLCIHRLSGKMCTFAHVSRIFFGENKETKKEAELQTWNSAFFVTQKSLPDSNSYFLGGKSLYFLPTMSKVAFKSWHFDADQLANLKQIVVAGKFDAGMPSPKEIGNVRMDALLAEDNTFGAIQLYKYVDLMYEPLMEVRVLNISEVEALTQILKK